MAPEESPATAGSRWKVGCCGFPRARGAYFAAGFPVVEVQQTFYRPPPPATLRRWRQEAPPHFEFTLKAYQAVTHPASSPTYRRAGLAPDPAVASRYGFFQDTPEVAAGWEATLAAAGALGATTVVLQCPASFTPTAEHAEALRRFVARHRPPGLRLAWEPRGAWPAALVQALCQELDLVHCVDPFEAAPLWGTPRYFRLHGGPRYRHRYSDQEFQGLLARWGGEEAYVLLNNSTGMWDDALRLLGLLAVS